MQGKPHRLATGFLHLLTTPAVIRTAILGAALGMGANAVSGLPPVDPLGRDRPALVSPNTDRSEALAALPQPQLEPPTGEEFAMVAPARTEVKLQVEKGDTLMDLLIAQGVPADDAHLAISALQGVYNPRHIKPGQELVLTFGPGGPQIDRFEGVQMKVAYNRDVTVSREGRDDFIANQIEKELERKPAFGAGVIESSLIDAGLKGGVPMAVMIEMIRAFSYDVDFQRDIHGGDRFQVVYNQFVDDTGAVAHSSDVVYAQLTLGGTTHRLYRYELDGEAEYFDEKGHGVRKALLRTPIDGARISSGFGMRRHPVLGYSKMHRGMDFAAPTGTPIMAAGSGTVEKAGSFGSYGNYIRIRHNDTFSTAYAHLSRYAKGLKAGARVKQGQIIGYVGTTGRSTGPHLHYEVMKGGAQVNPSSIKMPSGRELKGTELAEFQAARNDVDRLVAGLVARNRIASR